MKVYLVIDTAALYRNNIEKVYSSYEAAINYINTINKLDAAYYIIKEYTVE